MELQPEIQCNLKEISGQLALILKKITNIPEPKTDLVATALAIAQSEYEPLYFNKENKHLMTPFSNLYAILRATRPALNKNSLAFVQRLISSEDNAIILNSDIIHKSGQKLSSVMRIVAKNEYQVLESAINHFKCIAAQSLLGIASEFDVLDDNAERASVEIRNEFSKGTALNRKYNPKENSGLTISKDQLDELNYILADHMDIAEQLMEALKLQSLSDMPKEKYMMAVQRSHEIINAREGVK